MQANTNWGDLNTVLAMSRNGVKVINCSWGYEGTYFSTFSQNAINETYANGTILVCAAGNANNSNTVFPAAYNPVLSVGSIGSANAVNGNDSTYKDSHEFFYGYSTYRDSLPDSNPDNITNIYRSQTHNKQVDIMAPGYMVPQIVGKDINGSNIYGFNNGSSFAAPHVAGTIGLMFSVNSSLKPIEVESILKLTAVNIDTVRRNIQYAGMLGAGRLDAGKAVKMAYQTRTNDTLQVVNKEIYRWPLQIGNTSAAPFAIRVNNEILRDSVNAVFTTRKCITISNSTIKPDIKGSVKFTVDSTKTNYTHNQTPVYASLKNQPILDIHSKKSILDFSVYPIPAVDRITISTHLKQAVNIKVFNLNGMMVKSFTTDANGEVTTNVNDLVAGMYIIQVPNGSKIITKKIIVSR